MCVYIYIRAIKQKLGQATGSSFTRSEGILSFNVENLIIYQFRKLFSIWIDTSIVCYYLKLCLENIKISSKFVLKFKKERKK